MLPPFLNHWVNSHYIEPYFLDIEVDTLHSLKKNAFVLFLPLLILWWFRTLALWLFLAAKLHDLGLLVLESCSKKPISLSLWDQFLWFLLVFLPDIHAFVYSLSEFLDILHLLGILVINLLDDLEWSMRLTEYLIYLLSWNPRFFRFPFDFHAIICSLSTLDMEVNLTVRFSTLNDCSNIWSLLAADNTPNIELAVV